MKKHAVPDRPVGRPSLRPCPASLKAHSFPLRLALGDAPLEPHLGAPPLTTVNLASPLLLPHSLRHSDHGGASPLHGQGIGTNDGAPLDVVPIDADPLLRRDLLRLLVHGHVDDVPREVERAPLDLEHRQLGLPVLDVPDVPARAEPPQPELLAPVDQVAPRARGLDAQLAQLRGRQGEESLPGGEFGRVRAQAAADEREEGLDVRDEGGRRRYYRGLAGLLVCVSGLLDGGARPRQEAQGRPELRRLHDLVGGSRGQWMGTGVRVTRALRATYRSITMPGPRTERQCALDLQRKSQKKGSWTQAVQAVRIELPEVSRQMVASCSCSKNPGWSVRALPCGRGVWRIGMQGKTETSALSGVASYR